MLSFFFSYRLFSGGSRSSYRYVEQSLLVESEKQQRTGTHHALPNIYEDRGPVGYEEDLAPGGDHVKVLLLPKPFSPNFRENWDIYRTEYWEKENERRAIILTKLKERERAIAKQEGGWLWWTGYRGWKRGKSQDIEKTSHIHKHGHQSHHEKFLEKDTKRTRSGSIRSGSHSRNSSRSTTPTLELDDGPVGGHVRRGSSASSVSERRKKKAPTSPRIQKLTPAGSRSATPDVHSPLVRESSVSSQDSERPVTPGASDGDLQSLRGGIPSRKTGSIRSIK